ncbi:hypothetical protein B0H14DRAFT_2658259 [Mycena olivaceomarginata]|nr:hypothetical protein B0H14DRAFT_2658259 [Mycena olivaceomarginata]
MSRTNEGMTTWLESLAMNSLKAMPNDTSRRLSFGDTVDEDHDDDENSGQDAEDGGVARWACHTQAGTQRRAQLEAGQNGRGNAQEGGAAARRVRGGGNRARACKEVGRGVHGREVQVWTWIGMGVWRRGRECGRLRRWRRTPQSETGVPKRVRVAAQVDAGRNGVASATLARTTRGGVGAGGGCTERAWQRTERGHGNGVDRGWDGRGERIQHPGGDGTGMAWRGRVVAEVTWQVRRGPKYLSSPAVKWKGTLEEQCLCRGEEAQLPLGRREGIELAVYVEGMHGVVGVEDRTQEGGDIRLLPHFCGGFVTYRSPCKSTTYVTTPPDILTSMWEKALKEHKFGDVLESPVWEGSTGMGGQRRRGTGVRGAVRGQSGSRRAGTDKERRGRDSQRVVAVATHPKNWILKSGITIDQKNESLLRHRLLPTASLRSFKPENRAAGEAVFPAWNQPAPAASLLPASPRAPAPALLATIFCQLPAASLEEAAPRCCRESVAFPAPRPRDRELPHERLARQDEAAARLAVLMSLPPSPTLSQEAHDEALAVFLALRTSPPPSVTTADIRRVSLVSWVHRLEASTTVV